MSRAVPAQREHTAPIGTIVNSAQIQSVVHLQAAQKFHPALPAQLVLRDNFCEQTVFAVRVPTAQWLLHRSREQICLDPIAANVSKGFQEKMARLARLAR